MTSPPCNACDCHLPLDADDLCDRCAGSLVHVWAHVDHPEPQHAVAIAGQDVAEKLSRAFVALEALRPKVAVLEQRAVEAEALADRWKQSSDAANKRLDEYEVVNSRRQVR